MASLVNPLALALVLLATLAGAGRAAQTVVLNPPFAREGVVGDVRDFRIHPASGQVLFRADARRAGVLELWRAPIDGSTRPAPVVTLPVDRAVEAYEFSPNGQWVVFLADAERDNVVELFSHLVGTQGATRLNLWLAAGRRVVSFAVTAGSTRVVFRAQTSTGIGLFSAPIDGSARAIALAPAAGTYLLGADGRVAFVDDDSHELFSVHASGSSAPVRLAGPVGQFLKLSPDGSTAVYSASTYRSELWSAPLDASAPPVALAVDLDTMLEDQVLVSPDGARVVYLAGQEIRSVPLGGGPSIRLGDPLIPGQRIVLGAISPDSERLVYRRLAPTGLRQELLSAPLDASASSSLLDGPTTLVLGPIVISSDGRRVVYKRGNESLNSVAIEGGASPLVLDGAAGRTESFAVSPDSARVVYTFGQGRFALHSVPIDRSSPPVVLGTGDTGAFALSPDSARAVFLAEDSPSGTDPVFELRSVRAADGSAGATLSAELARGISADVGTFALDAAGDRALFTADPATDEFFELFSTRADGSTTARRLDGEVVQFQISADRTRAVYLCDPSGTPSGRELRSALADGSGAPVRLDAPGAAVTAFALSPDSARVVYVQNGLFAVAIGGGVPVTLASGFVVDSSLRITPDSSAVLFAGGGGLLRVPLDGSTAPVVLDPDADPFEVQITADGSRVVYTHREDVFHVSLWSAPIDASASPVELSPSLVLLTQSPVLSPDGQRVVFVAAPSANPTIEHLYSARADGGSSSILLGLDAPRRVLITPDSRSAVCIGTLAGHQGLFLVPLDGSGPPARLDDPSGAQGNLVDVRTSPDGTRALFVAGPNLDQALYSVPLSGAAVATRLTSAADAFWQVDARISADSASVVFLAIRRPSLVLELFHVPIDGSRLPVPLCPPLAKPGCSSSFQVSPDSQRVVYRATRTSGVTELLASELPALPQQRHLQQR